MASKRQKTTQTDKRASVLDAALRLAAKRDWANVRLSDIARDAKIPLSQLAEMFDSKEDIVGAYQARVDRDVLESFSSSGEERDQIFDVLMERFERLNADRDAVVSMLSNTDPKQIVTSLPHVARSMTWMLEACGIETEGPKGALRVAGLSGIYIWVLRTWRDDESADLAKTMASLDKILGRAENIANTIGL